MAYNLKEAQFTEPNSGPASRGSRLYLSAPLPKRGCSDTHQNTRQHESLGGFTFVHHDRDTHAVQCSEHDADEQYVFVHGLMEKEYRSERLSLESSLVNEQSESVGLQAVSKDILKTSDQCTDIYAPLDFRLHGTGSSFAQRQMAGFNSSDRMVRSGFFSNLDSNPLTYVHDPIALRPSDEPNKTVKSPLPTKRTKANELEEWNRGPGDGSAITSLRDDYDETVQTQAPSYTNAANIRHHRPRSERNTIVQESGDSGQGNLAAATPMQLHAENLKKQIDETKLTIEKQAGTVRKLMNEKKRLEENVKTRERLGAGNMLPEDKLAMNFELRRLRDEFADEDKALALSKLQRCNIERELEELADALKIKQDRIYELEKRLEARKFDTRPQPQQEQESITQQCLEDRQAPRMFYWPKQKVSIIASAIKSDLVK